MTANEQFRNKLVHEITAVDRKNSTKKGYNPYALGIMFGAVDSMFEEIANGQSYESAFQEHFTPTRDNHGIAKRLGLNLDVQRGQWIRTA